MDVALARTFLEVVAAGSFVDAAARLHVSQSTVSMRIRSLEQQLGRMLFLRGKTGAQLTPAGQQFQRHAVAFVRLWEQARHEVGLPPGYRRALAVGGQISLWDGFLLHWLAWMRAAAPDIASHAQFGTSDVLMARLTDGTLDLAVMYRPQSRPGFSLELLFEEELVLVSDPSSASAPTGDGYVYVDWGPEFRADHGLNHPDLETAGLHLEIGSLGLSYLRDNGGAGYFPKRVVRPFLDSGELLLVPKAPPFLYPAYVVAPLDRDPETIDLALEGLRMLARREMPA